MALRWFATTPIHFYGVRAFNPGDYVPDSIVTAHGLASQGRVLQVDVPTENPADVLRPLTTRDVDTDSEREAFVPSRLAAETLRAAFGRLPAHAGSRNGHYDPARSLYNLRAANTRRLRASLGAARAGTGLCRVFFAGDSTTAGLGSTRGTSDPVTYARGEFTRLGYGTDELVNGWTNNVPEPRLVFGGGADGGNGGSSNTRMPYLLLWGAGQSITHTGSGTVLEIVTTDAGAYTYKIDGGSAVTVTGADTAAMRRTVITGLANTSHTVVITATTPSVYFYAAGFRQATGVVVENGGISGSTATDWISGPFGGTNFAPGWSAFSGANAHVHDCVIIELGLNHLFQSLPAATFGADLSTLVGWAAAGGATVLLVASNYPQDADTTWRPYLSAIYDVADARNVPLLDLGDRWGPFPDYNADGTTRDLATDGVHLTPAGNAAKAAAWLAALTA